MCRELSRVTSPIFHTISCILHPLSMAVWMAVMVMLGLASPLTYPTPVKLYVVATVAFTTLFIPVLFGWLLRIFGVRKRGSDVRRTRLFTMLMMAVCYASCGWIFEDIVVLFLMRKILYTFTAVTAVVALFEFIYPLSLHTSMFGAVMGMMWMLLVVGNVALLLPFIIGIVLVGLLISARLALTDCRVGSAVWGALIGFAISALTLVVI